MADPGDDEEFDADDGDGNPGGGLDIGNEVRQGVAKAADRGHQAANKTTRPGVAAAGE